jgi:hypothetical protein
MGDRFQRSAGQYFAPDASHETYQRDLRRRGIQGDLSVPGFAPPGCADPQARRSAEREQARIVARNERQERAAAVYEAQIKAGLAARGARDVRSLPADEVREHARAHGIAVDPNNDHLRDPAPPQPLMRSERSYTVDPESKRIDREARQWLAHAAAGNRVVASDISDPQVFQRYADLRYGDPTVSVTTEQG